nr:S8 serine protease [Enterocytospora artemiae]
MGQPRLINILYLLILSVVNSRSVPENDGKGYFANSSKYDKKKYIVTFKIPESSSYSEMLRTQDNNFIRIQSKLTPGDSLGGRNRFGFFADLMDETRRKLEEDPSIAAVEEDTEIKIQDFQIKEMLSNPQYPNHEIILRDCAFGKVGDILSPPKNLGLEIIAPTFILQKNSPWGLSKVSGYKNDFEYISNGGEDVFVYVLDTGIDIGHPEFEGRAEWGGNFANNIDMDEVGHGTHCAGTIAGLNFGIAKKANLVAVKVLNGHGAGMVSSFLEGIDFVINDFERKLEKYYRGVELEYYRGLDETISASNSRIGDISTFGYFSKIPSLYEAISSILSTKTGKPKAVVNLSLGGPKSHALNSAIHYASKFMNIHFSTAAGNQHESACKFSPASSEYSLTIGANDSKNQISDFSNVGKCVDIYAPGTDILSAWPRNLEVVGRKPLPSGETNVLSSATEDLQNSGVDLPCEMCNIVSGTSMAAPHVAGIMAVYISLMDLTVEELKEQIKKDSEKIISDKDDIPAFPMSLFVKNNKFYPMASLRKLYLRLKTANLNK